MLSFAACILYLTITFPSKEYINKGKCLRNIFKDYCLVLNFNSPSLYKKIQTLRELYADVFGKILICGPEPDAKSGRHKPDIEFENEGRYGYHCLGLAVNKHPDYKGISLFHK